MIGRTQQEVRRTLGGLDPSASGFEPSAPEVRAETLRRVLATPRQESEPRRTYRRPGHRAAVAVGLALVLAIGGVLAQTVGSPTPAYAATPPLLVYTAAGPAESPPDVLRPIARRTQALPPDPAGRFQHLRAQSWSLFTRIDGERVTSSVVPEEREEWRGPDGSGTLSVRRLLPDGAQDGGTTSYPAGAAPYADALPVPDEPASLAAWLRLGHPAANGPAETLVAITDLTRRQVLVPRQRAALLQVLAGVPGLRYDGTASDRAGRPGQAFSVDSAYSGLPTRYTLLIDEQSGAVLDFEQVLTQTPGALDVTIPAVIGYEVFTVSENAEGPA